MAQPFELAVEGMHCGACVRRVRAALDTLSGLTVGDVAIGKVSGTLETATVAEVIATIGRAGYTARV